MTADAPQPLTARSLRPGMEIEGFRLVEKCHAGGMASLWRVEPVARAGGPFLMKVPHFGAGEERSAIIGFEVEQMIQPRLEGPHVPQVIATGDFAVLPFIVMEEVAGESLEARAARAPMPVAEVVSAGTAIARALADLHRQRTVHLDLKPANVILRPSGEAVLIDFGLAHHADLPDLLAEESELPMGTGAYIAPEQLAGVRNDPRSDLYALGIILYRLATGTLPFGEPESPAGMRRRLRETPAPPRTLRPDLPEALEHVILRALAVDPARRYQSAGQIAFDLLNPGGVRPPPPPAERPGLLSRLFGGGRPAAGTAPPGRERLARPAPIVMAAVDLAGEPGPLAAAIRLHVRRQLEAEPDARLTCVTVLRTALLALDAETDAEGRDTYVGALVALRDWARPLGPPAEAASFHVLEAVNPAAALVEYARRNSVDHIVMGARASGVLRRYLGSVSAEVVAEAPCTVTVVRV
jgi:nucleotide-binding universal stress UspA family protein